MIYDVITYTPERKQAWDEFVLSSRNATFLHLRGYMDYHADRFHDSSRMVYKNGRLVALLPANLTPDGILHSHQGLTYGGWLLPPAHLDGADLLEIFQTAISLWKAEGIKELDYKPIPTIYHKAPSQEDLYALFRLGAETTEVNLSMAIDLSTPPRYNTLRRRSLKKASTLDFTIEETDDCDTFISLVNTCLSDRHNARAVHTPAELSLLRTRFPSHIRLFWLRPSPSLLASSLSSSSSQASSLSSPSLQAPSLSSPSLQAPSLSSSSEAGGACVLSSEGACSREAGCPAALVCVYETGQVAHAQYIATTPYGRDHNLLTPLFDYLIREVFASRRYFDFGTSNEAHGLILNEGLLRQKASYGASGIAYPRLRLRP